MTTPQQSAKFSQTDEDAACVCTWAKSHVEDPRPYITAFIGHNGRAIQGLCQDVLFIFLTLSLALIICTVTTQSCILTLPGDSFSSPILKEEILVACCCSRLLLFVSDWVCSAGSRTWPSWTRGKLPTDKGKLINWHICMPHGLTAVGEERINREKWEKQGNRGRNERVGE